MSSNCDALSFTKQFFFFYVQIYSIHLIQIHSIFFIDHWFELHWTSWFNFFSSFWFYTELKDDANVAEKMLAYNRANRSVAILCNHQRSVPKNFTKQMEDMEKKVSLKYFTCIFSFGTTVRVRSLYCISWISWLIQTCNEQNIRV